MTEALKNKCELFAENRSVISKKFMFEKSAMSIVAGLLFTGADRNADVEKLTECRSILNKHTGFFSEYRDTVRLALISEMALSEDPEKYIEDVKAVYKKLHKGKIRDNSYMVLAAMLICDLGRQDDTDGIIEKYSEIMNTLDKEHPVLTDSGDISYVILLALSDRSAGEILSDINDYTEQLKVTFRHKAGSDSIQGLSEILALTDGDTEEKCSRISTLYDALKTNKAEIGDGYVFMALGTLVGIDAPAEELVSNIIAADAFLRECRGFDEKSVSKKDRLMFAVTLTAESYAASSAVVSNTFINSALGMVRAQKIATMITVISNILPSVLGALADHASGDKSDSTGKQTEQDNADVVTAKE